MKVQINIDAIGDDLILLIKDKLKERNLPECIGDMCPPIVSSIIEVEDTFIFSDRAITPPENIIRDNVLSLLSDSTKSKVDSTTHYGWLKNSVLAVNGEMKIKEHKEVLSSRFADKIVKCVNCKFKEVCNQLTTHYLETIHLKETL